MMPTQTHDGMTVILCTLAALGRVTMNVGLLTGVKAAVTAYAAEVTIAFETVTGRSKNPVVISLLGGYKYGCPGWPMNDTQPAPTPQAREFSPGASRHARG